MERMQNPIRSHFSIRRFGLGPRKGNTDGQWKRSNEVTSFDGANLQVGSSIPISARKGVKNKHSYPAGGSVSGLGCFKKAIWWHLLKH